MRLCDIKFAIAPASVTLWGIEGTAVLWVGTVPIGIFRRKDGDYNIRGPDGHWDHQLTPLETQGLLFHFDERFGRLDNMPLGSLLKQFDQMVQGNEGHAEETIVAAQE